MAEVDCFAVISEEVLAVLLDLPPELRICKLETSTILSTDGTRRTVHLFHFKSDKPNWKGEVSLMYHINDSTGATSLHSIGYPSANLEEGTHAPQGQDAGGAG